MTNFAPVNQKSCYVLELSVRPGGARRGDFFTYNNIEHIRSILEQEFLSENEEARALFTYLATCYGETIALWVIQASKIVKVIDLRPYIVAHFPDGLVHKLDQDLLEDIEDGCVAEFDLNWEEIQQQIPVLQEPLLQPGEYLQLSDWSMAREIPESYMNGLGEYKEINYGMWNEEYGESIEEFFIAPDPG